MKKDKLYQLIKTLGKAEKRYFRLFSNMAGDGTSKKYLKIFDILKSMSEYKEDLFVLALRKEGIETNNISSDKNYLYGQILKSLSLSNSEGIQKLEIRRLIDYADILFERGMYKESLKMLRKAKKIAVSYHVITLMPDILLAERKTSYYLGIAINNKQNFDCIKTALDNLNGFVQQEYFYRETIGLLQQTGKARNDIEESRFDDLEQKLNESNTSEIHAQIRKNQSMAAIYFSRGKLKEEYRMMHENISLMDAHPKLKEIHVFEYAVFMSHLLRMTKYLYPDKYDERLQAYFEFGDSIKPARKKTRSQIFSLGYSTEMVRLIEKGRFGEGISLQTKIRALEKEYGNLISKSIYMNFEYKLAYCYFGLGDLSNALKQINYIINHFKESDRKDIYKYAKTFSLVIHYELGNHSLVSYRLKSLLAYLKKRNLLYTSESILLRCLKLLISTKNKKEHIPILENMKNEMVNGMKQNPKEQHFIQFFDAVTWMESQISGVSFGELKA